MQRLVCFALCASVLALFATSFAAAQENKPGTYTDPAQADADLAWQGEYSGQLAAGQGKPQKFGVQVIALGSGKFQAVGYRGGLPGDGWDREDKTKADGTLADGAVTFEKFFGGATLKEGALTIQGDDGRTLATLRRVERKSPTLGAKPPSDAIVLFDGSTNDFQPGTTTADGLLTVPQKSKQQLEGDFTLHVEFITPYQPAARGQGRGNSGVYLGSTEVQVLDSFGLEGKKNECGGLYGKKDCDLNMCLPPLAWQTYDIDYRAAKMDGGKVTEPAAITVRHNGTVIHDQVPLGGGGKLGITLQNHGNPVHYRNIWVQPRKPS